MSPQSTQEPAGAEAEAVNAPVLSANAVKAYESMLAAVPDAGGEGYERILEALAQATSLQDLDAPWRTRAAEQYLGIPLVIRRISKMASDYKGGLPWFLVVEAAVAGTGEPATFTTGSVNVVAQLVRAHALDLFPVTAVLRQSDRATREGYYPMRLEFEA